MYYGSTLMVIRKIICLLLNYQLVNNINCISINYSIKISYYLKGLDFYFNYFSTKKHYYHLNNLNFDDFQAKNY